MERMRLEMIFESLEDAIEVWEVTGGILLKEDDEYRIVI